MINEIETQPMDTSTSVSDIFNKVLAERLQSGALERAIEEQVDKLITSVADDVFRNYGAVGKVLKEKLTASIIPTLNSMGDLPVYHDFVMNRLKLAAQNFYDQRLADVVDAELKKVFTELPEQITLSWIVEQIVNDAIGDGDGSEITLIIDANGYSWTPYGDCVLIYIDTNENVEKRNCKFFLHLSKNKESGAYDLLGIKVNGYKPGDALSVGRIYNTEKILFNIYAMKGRIIIDEGFDAENYDTSYERECSCD